MEENYLYSVTQQFKYYKMLGEKTFDQLADEELFWQYNDASNSIDVMVKHIVGNMLSRWTDFLTSDGEKKWRNRDDEFESTISNREELINYWEKGWTCLFQALESINKDNFYNTVYIRNMGHTVVEAVNRQLAHYAYHIGQIVFVGRVIKDQEWQSLSIPKGESKNFNKEKFSKEKRREHFTQQFLNDTVRTSNQTINEDSIDSNK